MQINQLSTVDTINAGDLTVIFSTNNGDTRAAAMSVLLAYLQKNLTANGGLVTQYAAPNASGFTVNIAPPTDGANVYLLMTPTGAFAAGTINLPSIPKDGQEILVTSTKEVTTLTVATGTINGAPTTIAANGFFRLRYDGVFKSWYRIG